MTVLLGGLSQYSPLASGWTMMFRGSILPLAAFMVLVGCNGGNNNDTDGEAGGDPDPADTDTDPGGDTDDGSSFVSSCPDGLEKFRALDIPGAFAAYDACVSADPGNSEALAGRGLTDLMQITEWGEIGRMLGWCDEAYGLDGLYGAEGAYRFLAEGDGGDLNVTTEAAASPAAPGEAYELIPVEPYVFTEIDGTYVRTYVENLFGRGGYMRFSFLTDDAQRDGSNLPLESGLTIDLATLSDPERVFYYRSPCDAAFSSCEGYEPSTEGYSGTITVTEAGDQAGETLTLTLDVVAPGYCTTTPCNAVHRIQGTVSDEVLATPTADSLPFSDVDGDDLCKGKSCGEFPWMNFPAELCEVPSLGALHDELGSLAAGFRSVADDLEAAGASADAVFPLPHEANPIARHDVLVNQADLLGAAAFVRAAVVTFEAAEQYKVAGDAERPEDFVSDTVQTYGSDPDACIEEPIYGTTIQEAVTVMNAELGYHRDTADFTEMAGAFADMVADVRAVLAAAPTGQGFLNPDAARARTYLDAIDADLVAVEQSQGNATSSVPLPSANIYELSVGAFFESPPEQDTLLTDKGLSALTSTRGECQSGIFASAEIADWLAEGARVVSIPRAVLNGDEETYPAFLDGDLWETATDENDEVPFWLDRQTLTELGVDL